MIQVNINSYHIKKKNFHSDTIKTPNPIKYDMISLINPIISDNIG